MDTYLLGLYLHLLSVAAAFSGAAILHSSLVRVKKAERIPQAVDALGTLRWLAPRMPIVAVALLLTGVWLTQSRWGWSQPWVVVGAIGLITMPLTGILVAKPRMMKLGMAFGKAGDGPVTEELRAQLRDPLLWIASHYPPIMAATIMYMMTLKPGYVGCVVAMGVAIVLSVGASMPMAKK